MADGDYFARNLPPGWRTVERGIGGGHDADFVVEVIHTAMTQSMVKGGGIPGLNPLADKVADGDREAFLRTAEQALADYGHHFHTEKAVEAGLVLMETAGERLASMSTQQRRQAMAEATMESIAAHGISTCQKGELPESWNTMGELRAFERQLVEKIEVERMAAKMLEDETGAAFRKPRRAKPPAGTQAVLDRRLV